MVPVVDTPCVPPPELPPDMSRQKQATSCSVHSTWHSVLAGCPWTQVLRMMDTCVWQSLDVVNPEKQGWGGAPSRFKRGNC